MKTVNITIREESRFAALVMQPGWRNCSPSCIPRRLASDMQPLARNDSAAKRFIYSRAASELKGSSN
jgi:hypothetical protein